MRAVNLLPAPRVEKREDKAQNREQTTKVVAIAGGAVLALVAIVLGFTFVQGRSHVSDRKATLAGLQAQVAKTQAAAAVSAAVAAQRQAHLNAVRSAASGRTAWDGLLDQLSRVMPSDAWLESLQTTPAAAATTSTDSSSSDGSAVVTSNALSSSSGAAPTGATFTVTGYARSQDSVARALERLTLMPALSNVSLQSTQRADVGAKKAVQFTIVANVRSAGGNG